VLAQQKRRTLLYPEDGQEKQAEVVIDAGGIGLRQSANRAALWRVVDPPGFGLHSGDQKHGPLPLGLGPVAIRR
jgi:hypothetical protein